MPLTLSVPSEVLENGFLINMLVVIMVADAFNPGSWEVKASGSP